MGAFRVPLEIGNPQGQRREKVEALVNTGTTYTVVPASVLHRLGVEVWERHPFLLADGRQAEYAIGMARLRLEGRSQMCPVVFGEEGITPLLGVVTLEIFRLAVDPVGDGLSPCPS
ncbi:MAG: aspartyl protease family protein [Dehalococcoidia bacterium]|nr:aspartyl protease family protein [Dehalococcoidia bacterium]MDW8120510.1 aspartyl protease family protein [Chloroflexota bacterium]